MLQIDTSKYDQKRWHDVKIGEHHFRFRELGAGEMLGFTQVAERATQLSSKKNLSDTETQEMTGIASKMIEKSLSMFDDPSGEGKVESVIGQYEALDLFDMVNKIREQIKNAPETS